jgi:hypothetical protein
LLVINGPVNFVVVTSTQVNHNVFVSVEEHDSDWIVEFVHLEKAKKNISNLNNSKNNMYLWLGYNYY